MVNFSDVLATKSSKNVSIRFATSVCLSVPAYNSRGAIFRNSVSESFVKICRHVKIGQ